MLFVSLTLGDSEDVDVVVDGEDGRDGHGALEQVLGELDLSGHIATVDWSIAEPSTPAAKTQTHTEYTERDRVSSPALSNGSCRAQSYGDKRTAQSR